MPKRTELLRRVRLGPLDVVTGSQGRIARLLDSPLGRRFGARAQDDQVVLQPRVTKEDLQRVAETSPEAAEIVNAIQGLAWYHTLDLGHGVRTPGQVDHRAQLAHYGLPESLAGKRCLDVATFDGFWAFEFERRGSTDVVAIDVAERTDIDCPRWVLRDAEAYGMAGETLGASFRVAHRILGSKVQRVEKSVYNLDPNVDGMFDFAFISDVLLHLRDPQLALERIRSVTRGEIILADVYSPELEGLGAVPAAQFNAPHGEVWWYMNVACLKQMLAVAGFEPVTEISRFVLDMQGEFRNHKVVLRGVASEEPTWARQWRESRGNNYQARRDQLRT